MFGSPNSDVLQQFGFDFPVASTIAEVDLAATANVFWVIDSIQCSYDADTAVGKLTVDWGPTPIVIFSLDILLKGIYEIIFPRGLYTPTPNNQVTVTLADPGDTITGKLNVTFR